jgi:hypothetical protein
VLTVIPEAVLFRACKILFDPELKPSQDFLRDLEPLALKSAYRKKVFETHPDRAKTLGKSQGEMHRRFGQVVRAYQLLNPVVEGDPEFVIQKPSKPQKQQKSARSKHKKPRHLFHRGALPERELLLGQFLYYSGIIPWKTLINAIVWQRMQRPLLGQIACQWNMLTDDEVQKILKERSFNEKFGAHAFRKGYITSYQLLALVGRQRSLQQPIGQFFIKHGILTAPQLEHLVAQAKVHNLWSAGRK